MTAQQPGAPAAPLDERFESSRIKVNDNEGNPIEIAAVVVWRVVETYEACFHVDDYENYVHVQREIQERLDKAGVEVLEARISHLAYAPEIAAAMLQRQQACAIIAARQRIVEGAVGMVEMALEMLSRRQIVKLDDERRAAMVSNLLVVLCADREVLEGVQRWANDDLRSLNGQIEFLLRRVLQDGGRLPRQTAGSDARQSETKS